MSERMKRDMIDQAAALERQAFGFKTAGERGLANTAHAAAMSLRQAADALSKHQDRLFAAITKGPTQ